MDARKADAVEPESEREHVIARVFDAPARLLFEAYSKREHLMKWFGPKGWPVTMCEIDFRVGGKFRMQMEECGSGQKNTPFGGTYLEIIPNEKIEFDNGFETPGVERMIMTVTFVEKDGKTTLTLRTLFGSVKMKRAHLGMGFDGGTNSGFDQLAELVVTMEKQ